MTVSNKIGLLDVILKKILDENLTTYIYDKENAILAADTRWSAKVTLSDGEKYLVYADESDYQKIIHDDKWIMGLAGNLALISDWKRWFFSSIRSAIPTPPVEAFYNDGRERAVVVPTIIKKENFGVKFYYPDPKITIVEYCDLGTVLSFFTGSGMTDAANCWKQYKDAKKAVVTASQYDIHTSSNVVYISPNENNINNSNANHDVVIQELITKGYIMNVTSKTEGIPLKDHPLCNEVIGKIKSGEATIKAPVAHTNVSWSEENRNKLKSVTAQM